MCGTEYRQVDTIVSFKNIILTVLALFKQKNTRGPKSHCLQIGKINYKCLLHQVTVFDSLQVVDSVGSFSLRRCLFFWLSFSSIIPYKNMWHPFWKKVYWRTELWIHYQKQKWCLVYYAKKISFFHVKTNFYKSITVLVNSCYF